MAFFLSCFRRKKPLLSSFLGVIWCSERYIKEDSNPLRLDFGGEDALAREVLAALEAAKETITYERKKKKEDAQQPVRQPLPAHLEHKEEVVEPNPLHEGSKCIGEEVTEVLEYTPYIQMDETTIPVMDRDHPGSDEKGLSLDYPSA